jgi:catechol 2,3-dioxygenase-like lactoylglutathione lyase family enzyme
LDRAALGSRNFCNTNCTRPQRAQQALRGPHKETKMTTTRLEHVNITVTDNTKAAQWLIDIFGWHSRWQGPSASGGNSIHVGSDSQYIALYSPPKNSGNATQFAKGLPLNHICLEVDDLDAIEAKVAAAGFTPFNHGDYEPGRRFYYFDADGIEYEIVSYV